MPELLSVLISSTATAAVKSATQPLPSESSFGTTGTGVSPSFDLSNLWQAYRNNLQLLNLERQNLVTAKDNHDIAMDRYIQETFPVLKYARHKRVCWMPKNVFSRQNTTPNFAKFHYCKSAEKSPNIWSNKTLILLFHWANHLIKAISPIFMPLRTDITLHSRPFLLHLHTP